MKGTKVETEEMELTVKFWVPKELDGLVRYRIFRRFRPFHNEFMKVVKQELRKAGYAPIRGRKEG